MVKAKELIKKLQTEMQEHRSLLNQGESESKSRNELKELIESKEKQLAELQNEMDDDEDVVLPRRTDRPPKPTEKFRENQIEEVNKKEKRLLCIYEQWKILIRKSRDNIKEDISETELATMADDIEKEMNEIMKLYNEIRGKVTPSTELRRKIDACEAVRTL